MNRGNYSAGKRQREADQQKKQQEKAQRRLEKRERGPAQVEIVSAEDITGVLPSSDQALIAMEERATAPRSAGGIPARLFVGGLSSATTVDSLRKAFSAIGPVVDAYVAIDRQTGTTRGFGFVTMESRKDAPRAIEVLHGSQLDGSTLVVNVATERR